MKTIQEKIEIMVHFMNGGEVEYKNELYNDWNIATTPTWDWVSTDFRIKEYKKTITIEKWLMKDGNKQSFFITEGDKSFFENYYTSNEKIKLLDTYEVEL